MPLVFSHQHQPTSFYNNAITLDAFNSKGLTESYETIRMEHAGMTFRNWCFDGHRMAFSVFSQQSATSYEIKNDLDAVKIYFNKQGHTNISYYQLNRQYALRRGQFNMLYSAELDSCMSHVDNTSEMFSLQVTRDCFFDFIDEGNIAMGSFADMAAGGRPALFSEHWLPMTPAIERCIDDVLNCPFAHDVKKLYLRAKATELLVLFATAASEKTIHPAFFVKRNTDRDKLYAVKNFIEENYTQPLSLTNLSKQHGLNEFKLKNGFRELFGSSVIDYLISCRLEQARVLLLNTGKQISEIAFETGYSSPAYFSKAYKKKFGVSPGKCQ
ncbi:MAG TPA: AraC family transcriptional regulator [Chitinophaga sp.]|uniref:helix-turn-helix domain-containing protein n=1 Tax=Chitinophaga sp. TaxID=1869181 RepID=UPI002CA14532|nr:AraC family transcriptional regulator [Chitinophaga sp.]HVI46400.1 AraC family transcriptional regulator [Chitinophaga sp.]